MKPWEGKQLWIWNVPLTNGGYLPAIINQAKRMNLSGVLVKYHEGNQPYGRNADGTRAEFQQEFRRVLPALKAAGLTVGAWGYNYMDDPEGEAAMICEALKDGADWYCFDPEGEVERAPHEATKRCLEAVVNEYPYAVLGYAPFPISQYHSAYPYQLFDQYCDVCLPQVYWRAIGWEVDSVWNMMVKGFDDLGLKAALAPIGQAYDNATSEEIKRFVELSKGCGGVSFWVWEEATPEQIQAITEVEISQALRSPTTGDSGSGNTIPLSGDSGTPQPPPSPAEDKLGRIAVFVQTIEAALARIEEIIQEV